MFRASKLIVLRQLINFKHFFSANFGLIIFNRIIPESPRWLLAKGKSTEADIALEKIVNYNGCCTRLKKISKSDIVLSENETPVNRKREKTRTLRLDLESATVNKTPHEKENLLEKSLINSEYHGNLFSTLYFTFSNIYYLFFTQMKK